MPHPSTQDRLMSSARGSALQMAPVAQSQAAMTAAMNAAPPLTQQVAGQQFEPWQQAGREQALTFALSALPGAVGAQGTNFSDILSEVGGTPTEFSNIPIEGVLSPLQIQSRVNSTTALGNATAQGNLRQLQEQFAGRGFGSNSPLMAELSANIYGQALAGNTAAELNFREQSARDNAVQMLGARQAQTNVEQARSQDELQRRAFSLDFALRQFERENALLQAISGYTSPLDFSISGSAPQPAPLFGQRQAINPIAGLGDFFGAPGA